ncbi:MAG: hypothetical protein Q9174_005353 [Haloplaca sp. 1 TL-2023]
MDPRQSTLGYTHHRNLFTRLAERLLRGPSGLAHHPPLASQPSNQTSTNLPNDRMSMARTNELTPLEAAPTYRSSHRTRAHPGSPLLSHPLEFSNIYQIKGALGYWPPGVDHPEFCHRRSPDSEGGQTKEVILASRNGTLPSKNAQRGTLMLREWDPKYCFWTLEKGPHTFVVYYFSHDSAIGPHWRCWLGVRERYEAKAVAFPIDADEDSTTDASDSDDQTPEDEDEEEEEDEDSSESELARSVSSEILFSNIRQRNSRSSSPQLLAASPPRDRNQRALSPRVRPLSKRKHRAPSRRRAASPPAQITTEGDHVSTTTGTNRGQHHANSRRRSTSRMSARPDYVRHRSSQRRDSPSNRARRGSTHPGLPTYPTPGTDLASSAPEESAPRDAVLNTLHASNSRKRQAISISSGDDEGQDEAELAAIRRAEQERQLRISARRLAEAKHAELMAEMELMPVTVQQEVAKLREARMGKGRAKRVKIEDE